MFYLRFHLFIYCVKNGTDRDVIPVKAVNKQACSWSATEALFAVLPAYQARDQEQNPATPTFVNNYKSV